jgi:hypothetical protein
MVAPASGSATRRSHRPRRDEPTAARRCGSGDPDQPTEAQVDPREHRRALIEALDVVLLVGDAVAEAAAVDAERAKREEAPKRKATTGSVEHRGSGTGVRTSLTASGPSASTSMISHVR